MASTLVADASAAASRCANDGTMTLATPTSTPPSTSPSSSQRRADILDSLADAFDDRRVPSELLDALQEKETKSIGRIAKTDEPQKTRWVGVPCSSAERSPAVSQASAQRGCVLTAAFRLLGQAGQSQTCFIEVARVFDLLPQIFVRDLAALSMNDHAQQVKKTSVMKAVALCKVSSALGGEATKTRQPGYPGSGSPQDLYKAACSLCGEALDFQRVAHEEQEILKYLDSAPCVATWLQIFTERLDIVTGGKLKHLRSKLELITIQLALPIVWAVPTSADRPPRTTALGVLTLALVVMNIAPIEVLQLPSDRVQQVQALLHTLREQAQAQLRERLPTQDEIGFPRKLVSSILDVAVDAREHEIGAAAGPVIETTAAALHRQRQQMVQNQHCHQQLLQQQQQAQNVVQRPGGTCAKAARLEKESSPPNASAPVQS